MKKRYLSYIYAFCFVWGVGGGICESNHDRFDTIVRDTFQNILFPNNDNVYGFLLEF